MRGRITPLNVYLAMAMVMICLILTPYAKAQSTFSDYFEDGNVDGWSVISGDGSIEAVADTACNGSYSMRILTDFSPLTIVAKDNFSASTGTYQACIYSTRVDLAFLCFQYQDELNHYGVIIHSISGGLALYVRRFGVNTQLASISVPESEQASIKVVRDSDGLIELYYDSDLVFSGNDQTIMSPGDFCFGVSHSLYVDNVRYGKVGEEHNFAMPSSSSYGLVVLALLLVSTALWHTRGKLARMAS